MDMATDADINIEHRLTEVEQRAKSNTNRLNEHDEILKSNSEMIGAIKELATEVKYMRGDLNETVERLNKLEGNRSCNTYLRILSCFCRIKVRRGSNLSLYLILRYRSNY